MPPGASSSGGGVGGGGEGGGGDGGGGEGGGGEGGGDGGGGEGGGDGGGGDGGGGDIGEGGDCGGGDSELVRCPETRCISSYVRPRGHATTSAIAKSDWSPWLPSLTNSDTSPAPPVAVPTSTPFASFSCDPALVPHMTTQFVSGLTLFCSAVFHPW